MVQFSDLDFTQQMQNKEVGLHGLYVSISCHIEAELVDIIAKCEIADPSKREEHKVESWNVWNGLQTCNIKVGRFTSNPSFRKKSGIVTL